MANTERSKKIVTIPNILSLIRLLLVPVIIWLYLYQKDYLLAVILIGFSGLTDIVDGAVARRFNMISEVGKVLDPIADKLTQISIIVCLLSRYKLMWILVALFVMKETFMLVAGWITLKKHHEINGARWQGKVCTVVMYLASMVLVIFTEIPESYATFIIYFTALIMALALLLYVIFYIDVWARHKREGKVAESEGDIDSTFRIK